MPDLPFYLTYPALIVWQGKLAQALRTNIWPEPPQWLLYTHHALHSFPVALLGAIAVRLVQGRWPVLALRAWCLHILVDIPTHTRQPWGPKFLWPFSNFAYNGVAWTDVLYKIVGVVFKKK